MRTLIFNGSPHKNGDTMTLIHTLCGELPGEVKIVNAYFDNIRPCVDCRWCFKNEGCAIKDGMQEILDYIQECDHIVLASPIYFEELTGMLLAVLSRLQTLFSARYIRGEEPVKKAKTGGILLTAGSIGPREKAESTAKMLLRQMNCMSLGTVYAGQTDKKPVREQTVALEEVHQLAERIKQGNTSL
jgi:multimeric flavodoxin WrbA